MTERCCRRDVWEAEDVAIVAKRAERAIGADRVDAPDVLG
jgi:hypothetical protein